MRKLFILAVFIGGVWALLKPTSNYLNRQSPIDPNTDLSAYDINTKLARFHGRAVNVPSKSSILSVLPETETDVLSSKSNKKEKRIEIDLTKQKLYAYSGNKKIHSFLVSTGKWGQTPTGEFRIWIKLEYTLMAGGSKALNTYYYLPNVPYTMYFYNESVPKYRGYGIHGTYWHNNFGHPMSHGCINMKTEEARILFEWAAQETKDDRGTKIVIYGTAPNS